MNTIDQNPAWPSSDPLGQSLHFLRMDGTFYCHSELSAPWGLEMPPIPRSLMFHVMLSGEAVLQVGEDEPLRMRAGDLVLVPHGRGHVLGDAMNTKMEPILEIEREHVSPRYERLEYGGGGAPTRLICGAVQFDHPAAFELVRMLPRAIHVRDWPANRRRWIENTLELMAEEATGTMPGGETVMTRLADILVIQAIRSWIVAAPEAQTGWLRAMHDPQIGSAIVAIHRDPGGAWTVESLAAHVGMSRSAFAARFAELVDDTPARYLTRWRMQVASNWLRDSGRSIGEIALELGYASQAAFSRAYKRWSGAAPIVTRRAA